MTIIAIDPGAKGGLACRMLGTTTAYALPETDGDRLELLRELKASADVEGEAVVVVLEKVSGFVGKRQPGSAMFNFGSGYGFLIGAVMALQIRLVLVTPQLWQKFFQLGKGADCASQSVWKNKLKAEAQRRHPTLKVTHATADALLICDWAAAQPDHLK